MAGHSKWATTKRHKAAVDAKRGKIFSVISKELTLAARAGGGDADMNPRLRTALLKAKGANMPADNIDRAIKKGTGEIEGAIIEELVYEGYAAGGVGIIVEVTTDNKNRSAGEIRSSFSKNGGNLAGAGALAFNFQRKGQFLIDAANVADEDELMMLALDAGAEDVENKEDHYEVTCTLAEFDALTQALEDAGIQTESGEMVYIPNSLTPITEVGIARQVLRLIQVLDDLEDVKAVHSNFDMDEALLAEASA
ncbi:MAG: YebC/PmpR family DNA-binding transcriptional regulator [Opitutales bacterium]|nr:YebC/PmpR family DNA-binding transcriptional regulator [Opitutales bacterium]NRA27079.1 YebC/PmpR family DNA-binding transcriptional regulator [Opitutales bacterium]